MWWEAKQALEPGFQRKSPYGERPRRILQQQDNKKSKWTPRSYGLKTEIFYLLESERKAGVVSEFYSKLVLHICLRKKNSKGINLPATWRAL